MRARNRALVAMLGLLLSAGLAQTGGSSPALQDRVVRLGDQLMCTCGCNQGLLVCNHVGCPISTTMRAELHNRSASSDSDQLVLQSFVQEYGTQVLANPTTHGFNLVAWVMPWVGLGLGLLLVLLVVKRWSSRLQPAEAAATDPGLQARVQGEIAAALRDELDRGPRR